MVQDLLYEDYFDEVDHLLREERFYNSMDEARASLRNSTRFFALYRIRYEDTRRQVPITIDERAHFLFGVSSSSSHRFEINVYSSGGEMVKTAYENLFPHHYYPYEKSGHPLFMCLFTGSIMLVPSSDRQEITMYYGVFFRSPVARPVKCILRTPRVWYHNKRCGTVDVDGNGRYIGSITHGFMFGRRALLVITRFIQTYAPHFFSRPGGLYFRKAFDDFYVTRASIEGPVL